MLRLLAALLVFTNYGSGAEPSTWEIAQREIRRLNVSAIPNLPASVRTFVAAKGCTIPQAYAWKEPHNVIKGEFAKKGQTDWALLCSKKDGNSSLVIHWGGHVTCPSELESRPDITYLQDIGEGKIGYSRNIQLSAGKLIFASFKTRGESAPSIAFDHDGLNDAFIEKASTIHYCHGGKWFQFQGAD